MKTIAFIVCLMAFPIIGLAATPTIDATSLETLDQSLKEAAKVETPEDIAVVSKLICESGHGFNLKDPKQKETVLEKLRARLQGKSVGAVVLEVKMEQAAAADKLKRQAEEYVRERHEKWRSRALHVHEIVIGTKREDVVKLLGKPDAQSNSSTVENWLFRYDAAQNVDQIWIANLMIQITNGAVSNITQSCDRIGIEDNFENK